MVLSSPPPLFIVKIENNGSEYFYPMSNPSWAYSCGLPSNKNEKLPLGFQFILKITCFTNYFEGNQTYLK